MVTPHDEQILKELQVRWPDFDITREWWGFLCVPRGTYPVVMGTFADSIDTQLMRIGEEPARAKVVDDLAGRRASRSTDDDA